MKGKELLLLMAIGGLLIGCETGRKEYAVEVQRAHEGLVSARPRRAESCLLRADRIAAEHGISDTAEAKLLEAEAKLALNDLANSESRVREVLAGRPKAAVRARAEEVLGKLCIRRGSLTEAQQWLGQAEARYESPVDQRRAADLLALAKGLTAYSDGDLAAAEGHWRDISQERLRLSVLHAVRSAGRKAHD